MMNLDDCPELATARLTLRRPLATDIEPMVDMVGEWEVARRLARVPYPYTRADARQFLEEVIPQEAIWAILQRPTLRLVGMIGLSPIADDGSVAELGYWIGMPFWGRGIGTEAADAVLYHAFNTLGLSEVVAGCFTDNPRSLRVLTKLGFRTIEQSVQSCLAEKRELPHYEMALIRADYLSRGPAGT